MSDVGRKIEEEKLLNALNYGKSVAISMTVIGLILALVLFIAAFDTNKPFLTILIILILSFPFWWIVGIKRIMNLTKNRKAILTGNYRVVRDKVIDVQRRQNISTLQTLLVFEKDSSVRGKGIWFPDMVWKNVKEGDIYYLVYLRQDIECFKAFSAKVWEK